MFFISPDTSEVLIDWLWHFFCVAWKSFSKKNRCLWYTLKDWMRSRWPWILRKIVLLLYVSLKRRFMLCTGSVWHLSLFLVCHIILRLKLHTVLITVKLVNMCLENKVTLCGFFLLVCKELGNIKSILVDWKYIKRLSKSLGGSSS